MEQRIQLAIQLQQLMHQHGYVNFVDALISASQMAADEMESIGQRKKADDYIMLSNQVNDLIK